MSTLIIPENYKTKFSPYETQKAIEAVKKIFQKNLSEKLNLKRVSAPLFVGSDTGLNDNLNGVERPVVFDIKETGKYAEVVHSLAKWKRMALFKYQFNAGKGLYTDLNAIRRDEEMDNMHSVYVDQWDWEKVIEKENRNEEYLKNTVNKIVTAIADTQDELKKSFPVLKGSLERNVSFITSQELEDLYPSLTPKERENEYVKKHKTVFIMKIGGKLKSGKRHDGRAPDYDDWNLNGDIMFYNEVLNCAFEISSMGIRVDKESLLSQLDEAGCPERIKLPFHKMLADGTLPLTMGGGIGQSRLCMLLMEMAHIGEVQVSLWDEETLSRCKAAGIALL